MRSAGRVARLVRAVLAALTLLVVVVGVPVALVKLVGWPLPHAVPDWHLAYRSIQQQDIPGGTIVKAVAVIVWIAWIQIAWAVLWEIAVNLPRYSRSERQRPAPGVSGSISHPSALVIGVVASPQGAMARSGGATAPLRQLTPASAVVVDSAVNARVPTSDVGARRDPGSLLAVPGQRGPSATVSPVWKVVKGDSLWSVAERALGDGTRYQEIMSLNPYLRTARDVRPGHLLELPTGADVPIDRAFDRAAEGASDVAAPDVSSGADAHVVEITLGPTTHVVAAGENLWQIGEERVRESHGEATPSDVAEYVDEMIDGNQDRLVHPGDPSLIIPGQVLDLPSVGDVAVESTAVESTAVADAASDAVGDVGVDEVIDAAAGPVVVPEVAAPVEAHPPIEVGVPLDGTFSPPLPPPAAVVGGEPSASSVDVFAWLAEQTPRLARDLHADERDADDGVLPIDLLAGVASVGGRCACCSVSRASGSPLATTRSKQRSARCMRSAARRSSVGCGRRSAPYARLSPRSPTIRWSTPCASALTASRCSSIAR
jgi:LysM repeat protein